jgi:hypothetical protein
MSIPDIDWSEDYERGYVDGMFAILGVFKQELYIARKEDPHYAAYIEDAINLINKKANPPIKE